MCSTCLKRASASSLTWGGNRSGWFSNAFRLYAIFTWNSVPERKPTSQKVNKNDKNAERVIDHWKNRKGATGEQETREKNLEWGGVGGQAEHSPGLLHLHCCVQVTIRWGRTSISPQNALTRALQFATAAAGWNPVVVRNSGSNSCSEGSVPETWFVFSGWELSLFLEHKTK